MENKVKEIAFEVINEADYITKAQIKERVLDIAVQRKILTKEFVIAFGDIGWRLQDLRQKDGVADCFKEGRNWFWYAIK